MLTALVIIVYGMSVLLALGYGIRYGQAVGYKAAIADVKKGDFDFTITGQPRRRPQ